jgi:hypothetical protein
MILRKKKILEIKRGGTRSHSVENSLCKRHEIDNVMMIMMVVLMPGLASQMNFGRYTLGGSLDKNHAFMHEIKCTVAMLLTA